MALNGLNRVLLQSCISCSRVSITGQRFYSRWMHRTPSKVLMPVKDTSLKEEKIISLNAEALNESRKQHLNKLQKVQFPAEIKQKRVITESIETASKETNLLKVSNVNKQKRVTAQNNQHNSLQSQKVFDENNEIAYEKLKDNDSKISTLLIKLKSKKERARTGQVLVEGWRMIVDGLEARCPLNYVVFSRSADLNCLKPYLPDTGVKFYKIPYKEIKLWSEVDTSPGIFGIFRTPTMNNIKRACNPLPLQIVCDNIRTPGNLGAILRAAVGVGCDKVFLMKGCVDLWDPKVIRSAMGAHFRLPVHNSLEWEQLPALLDNNSSVFVADSNAKVLFKDQDQEVSAKDIDDDTNDEVQSLEGLHIPVVPYYGVEYPSYKSLTLIIGGETEGISEDTYRFAANRNGLRLNIPLQQGVDSLNTGMATAVIAFEMKRQILEARSRKKMLNVAC